MSAGRDAVEWAIEAEARGAGEILLTSIDRDGTRSGFDCALTPPSRARSPFPVIASGGAGTFDHFFDVFTDGKSGRRARGLHLSLLRARRGDLKQFLHDRGVPVRI